ncbi:MAG TPA: amidohydrolase family protein [Acidimicrobiales bacterium]|nr:amidohydrolase family protein [Acidimicrobiales bacterium]
MSHDLVLRGGRVVDPESGFDRVSDVGIDGDAVTAIGDHLDGATTVDVSGLVVAPGFIDLHSHAQTLPGRRLQVCDGVTTALDLEAGRAPVELAYAREAARGSPINYGFSASWAAARMHVLAEMPLDGGTAAIFGGLVGTEWQQAATAVQLTQIFDQISADLADGAIGIGVLMGYTPGVDPAEYLALAELAASAAVPTFTHSRDIVELAPETLIDGAEEVVRAAGTTGAHMHYCHINSTSGRHIDRVLALVGRCQAEGSRITTEAYPYGSGSTAIGAAFLAPERLRERFRDTTSITYLRTGERIADDERLRELRSTDPGGLVIAEFLDDSEPSDAALLRRSLEFPDAIVASDGMPPLWTDTTAMDIAAWPLPPEVVTHPRTAGTFGRALRLWRVEGAPLMEALRRATVLPAQVLEGAVPAMRRKGRLRAGMNADLVVFDHARVTDQATYAASTRPSSGISHVLVNGTFVVRDGDLVRDARPGRPVRASPR